MGSQKVSQPYIYSVGSAFRDVGGYFFFEVDWKHGYTMKNCHT